jgi:hypothetical protein
VQPHHGEVAVDARVDQRGSARGFHVDGGTALDVAVQVEFEKPKFVTRFFSLYGSRVKTSLFQG